MILYLVHKTWKPRFLEQSLLLQHVEPAERTAGFCIFYYHRIHTVARNTSVWTNFIYFSGLFILEMCEYPGKEARMAAKTAVHARNTWLLTVLSVSGSTGSGWGMPGQQSCPPKGLVLPAQHGADSWGGTGLSASLGRPHMLSGSEDRAQPLWNPRPALWQL